MNRDYFYRQGCVVSTRTTWRDTWCVVAALLTLLALLAWGHAVEIEIYQTGAYDDGLAAGQAQMSATVGDAYHQGWAAAQRTQTVGECKNQGARP